MDLEGLNIQIGADLSQLEQAIPKFNSSVNAMGQTVQKTNAVLDQNAKNLARVGSSSAAASGGIRSLGQEASLSTRHALGFAQGMTELASDANRGALNLGGFFEVLRVGASEFRVIQKETGSSIQAFKELGGVIFSEELIILLAVTALAKLASAFLESNKKAKEATETNEKFFDSASQEITSLRVLEKLATDTSQSYDVRKKAVDELQKQYPSYLKNLSDEAILSGQAAAAINLISEALVKKAYFEAASANLQDIANKQLQAQKEAVDLTDKQRQAELELAKAKHDASTAGSQASLPLGGGTAGASSTTFTDQKQLTSIGAAEDKLKDIGKQLADNKKAQQDLNGEFQYYLNVAESFKAQSINLDPDPNGKAKTSIETLSSILAKLKAELDTDAAIPGFSDRAKAEIEAIQKAIESLTNLKVKASPSALKEINDQITKLTDQEYDLQFQLDDEALNKKIHELGSKLAHIDVPFNLKPLGPLTKTGLETSLQKDKDALAQQWKDLRDQATQNGIPIPLKLNLAEAKKFESEVTSLINDVNANLSNALSGSLTALGEGLGGGDFLSGFRQALGGSIKAIGEDFIKLGTLAILAKQALTKLFSNPYLEVAAGIALVAIGTKIESVQNKGVKLATGGIIPSGFPNDTFPAMLSSNEAVIPLDKGLGQYLNNEPMVQYIIPNTVLKGNDIVISYDRTKKQNGRTY